MPARHLARPSFKGFVPALSKQLSSRLLTSKHCLLSLVQFSDWERGQHLQSFVTLVWPTFNTMVCSIIKKEASRGGGLGRGEGVVGRLQGEGAGAEAGAGAGSQLPVHG